MSELFKGCHKVLGGPGEAVEPPDKDNIETPLPCVIHQLGWETGVMGNWGLQCCNSQDRFQQIFHPSCQFQILFCTYL